MKTILAALIAAPLIAVMGGCSHRHVATTATGKTVYGEQAQIIERLRNAGDDLKQLMNAPDNAIPQDVVRDAPGLGHAGTSGATTGGEGGSPLAAGSGGRLGDDRHPRASGPDQVGGRELDLQPTAAPAAEDGREPQR